MKNAASRTLWALGLQIAALALIVLALLGASWLDARSKPRLLVLVDRSQSMPREDTERALAQVLAAARDAGAGEPRVLEFAGRATATGLDTSATHLEAALDEALQAHARAAFAGVVVVSDGLENAGNAERALRAMHDAGLPVQWLALGRPPPPARITDVLAPDIARVGQRIRLAVQWAGTAARPLKLRARVHAADGQVRTASTDATPGRAEIEFDAGSAGGAIVDLTLEEAASGQVFDAWPDAAVIDVAPSAPILYAQGSGGALASSLIAGGWPIERVPAALLDAQTDALAGYRAVILDDVAVADAGPRFWSALVAAVKQRGVGLMVLGGERSFALGGYRSSALESVLPVLSEPAALEQAAAVLFAVDKSGSMAEGSGGVDRFQLAQRAVVDSARSLGEHDALGLLVFDVEPRVLVPLGPAAAGMPALVRDWPVQPNGGTRIVPALEAALAEFQRSGAGRRLLVVVTDGFIDEAPLAGLRARLEAENVETIALAVGADASIDALQRLVGPAAGRVRRVNEAAELPLAMRSELERRRARIQRGSIAVQQRADLPFRSPKLARWPEVAAYHLTRLQPDASMVLASRSGDPLLAWHNAGRGRVMALTSGLGAWAPQWLSWPEWPRLAGGLAEWISGAGGAARVEVSEQGGELRIDTDVPAGLVPAEAGRVTVQADTPAARGVHVAADPVAPGLWRATLPDAGPGLYTFEVSTALGSQRRLFLRRDRAETGTWGINPALSQWRAAGLIGSWDPQRLLQIVGRQPHAVDRSLLLASLMLFAGGVLVDRMQPASGRLAAAWTRRRRLSLWGRVTGRSA